MPRRARLAIAGIPWHIIQRGNNRSACFYAPEDYRRYLETLGELAKKYGGALHAYVLMTNHVHLLLTPEHRESAALLMKHLGQRYAQYINRTYRRSGTLWEGRFRPCLTQSEEYVLTWSSFRANAEDRFDPLLIPHREYLRLGPTRHERCAAYRALFDAHIDTRIPEIRRATNGNYALGDDRFKAEIARALNRRTIPGKSGRRARAEMVDG